MKTLFLFTLSVVLASTLTARENPFVMLDKIEEETGKMIETNESITSPEDYQEALYIKEMQEKMSRINENKNVVNKPIKKPVLTTKENKPAEKTYSKQEVDSLIKKTKKQTEQKTKEIVKKELANTKVEPEQVVYVKPRTDIAEEDTMLTKKISSFLNVEFNDNKLIIHTDYKVSKKFSIIKENKLVIDYKAKLNFSSKKDNLESRNFKKIALGNHKSEGYFRVVIELLNKPSNYDVSYKENLITIYKIK